MRLPPTSFSQGGSSPAVIVLRCSLRASFRQHKNERIWAGWGGLVESCALGSMPMAPLEGGFVRRPDILTGAVLERRIAEAARSSKCQSAENAELCATICELARMLGYHPVKTRILVGNGDKTLWDLRGSCNANWMRDRRFLSIRVAANASAVMMA